MSKIIPKLAGTCVLWRRNNGGEVEVLVIRRSKMMKFLPGQYAFPGGSVEEGDKRCEVHASTNEKEKSALIGAIRETLEETGYFPFNIKDINELKTIWDKLHNKEIDFYEIQKSLSIEVNIGDYPFSGPWITPPGLTQRFETYFYFIEWKPTYPYIENIKSDEVDLIRWDTPRQILDEWHKGELSLSTPVAYILEHIEKLSLPEACNHLKKIPWRDNAYPYFHPRAGLHLFPLPAPPLSFSTNVNSAVIGKEEMIIIDTGCGEPETTDEMIYWLENFVKLGSRFVGICITHAHPDHAGGLEIIANHFNIPKYAPTDFFKKTIVPIDCYDPDSHRFILGNKDNPWIVDVIPTPGHIKEHVSYYETTTKTFIAGDLITSEGSVVIIPDGGGSMSEYMDSLYKVSKLEIDLLIPGHGIPSFFTSGNHIVNRLIEHRKSREEKILQKIKEGALSFDDLLTKIYSDLPPARLRFARMQLKAHLIDLKNRELLPKEFIL